MPTQVNGGARHTESCLQLRAERAEFKVPGQYLGAVPGMLVATVVAHLFTQQTGTDAYRNSADLGFARHEYLCFIVHTL